MANFNQYEKLWNRHHIERVEIAMKETIDVKGKFMAWIRMCRSWRGAAVV